MKVGPEPELCPVCGTEWKSKMAARNCDHSYVTDYEQHLADYLHTALCGDPCEKGHSHPGYIPGNAHHDFYQLRAQIIIEKLEPIIGIANIRKAAEVIIEECL